MPKFEGFQRWRPSTRNTYFDVIEIGLAELLPRLEGLVEHRLRQQVPHLDADQRLAAAGGGLRHLDIEAVVRGVLELEKHFSLDCDGFNQGGHAVILVSSASWAGLSC